MSAPLEEADVERISMSTKEVRRAAVFAQVKAGRALLSAAALQLGVSYRQAKRLYALTREPDTLHPQEQTG